MPDYKQGKIYCLRSHKTDNIYIGSTIQPLYKRIYYHKKSYEKWENNKGRYVTSFELIQYDDCYIELLEEYPCDNRNQLERREGQLIRETDCVNKCIAGRTLKEYREEHKDHKREYDKEYREKNKIKRAETQRNYYLKNKSKYRCNTCDLYMWQKRDYDKHLKTKNHIKKTA